MTTAYTSLLGLALPVTGELNGTWGDVVNNSITNLLDSAIAGTTTLSTDADVTLTTTTGSANQSREAILLWTANGTTTRNITAPAQSKIYTVINSSAGTQSIVLRGAGPTTGVTIVKGESAVCAWNGSDFIKISNTSGAGVFTNLTASGTVTFSGGTANGVAYLNGSKVLTTGSILSFDGTSVGLGNTPSASWGTQALVLGKNGASNPTYPYIASTNSQDLYVGSNSYWDGTNWKAAFAGSAVTAMQQTVSYNSIYWSAAAAVSQNSTQNFLPAMTLTSTKRLGINTTTPTQLLDVGGIAAFGNNSSGDGTWAVNSQGIFIGTNQSTQTTPVVQLQLNSYPASPSLATSPASVILFSGWSGGGTYSNFIKSDAGQNLWFHTAVSGSTFSDSNPRMKIDNGGNVAVGTVFTNYAILQSSGSSSGNLIAGGFMNTSTGGTGKQVTARWYLADTVGSIKETAGITAYPDNSNVIAGGLIFSTRIGDLTPAESLRLTSAGTLILKGGSTAADGVGITFPATRVASTNGNTLDDYEIGSWTPDMKENGTGTSWTASNQTGSYVKIGRTVWIEASYTYTAKNGVGGFYAFLAGLPYYPANYTPSRFYVAIVNGSTALTSFYAGQANRTGSGTINFIQNNDTSGPGSMVANNFPSATATIQLQGMYYTDS